MSKENQQIEDIREISLDCIILSKAMDCLKSLETRFPELVKGLDETYLYLNKIRGLLKEIVPNEEEAVKEVEAETIEKAEQKAEQKAIKRAELEAKLKALDTKEVD